MSGKKYCAGCGSENLVSVSGKVSDRFRAEAPGVDDYSGYVPYALGIGGGDYVEFTYCLDCGRIVGDWPVDVADVEWD